MRILHFALAILHAVAAPAAPVISEFMAANATTIKDGHDNYEDWIEIRNPDAAPVDLAGWRLTDFAGNTSKFVFPAKVIPAGGRLLVFASNRTGSTGAATHVDVLGYLHTNFSLNKSGEYLALISPAGVVSIEFAPYPQQVDDISYGAPATTEALVAQGATVRYSVPTSTALDTASPNWTAASFNDASWSSGIGPGIGFEAGAPIAHWPLDDAAASTTAVDATGGGLNGTRSGSATFGVAGHSPATSTGVQFSSTIGKVTIPYFPSLNPAASFTFAAWVFPAGSTGTHQSVVTSRVGPANQQRGYILYINPSGQWEFWTGYNSGGVGAWNVVGGGAVTFGAWTHVAITRDAGGTKRLYINGVQAGSTSAANNYLLNNNTANGLHLGAGEDLGTAFRFNGIIDDATFWAADIGAALVIQHRDSGGGSFPTPAYTPHYSVNVQTAMFAINPGIYTRHNFVVPDKTRYAALRLRMKYDDAYVAFLNGVEIARGNFAGARAYDSAADSDRADTDAVVFENTDVTTLAMPAMVNGTNTLAIHGFRRSISHEDFLLTPQFEGDLTAAAQAAGYFAVATPGTTNSGTNVNPGPAVSNVSNSPLDPPPATAITITAHITPRLAPIAGVSLKYRVMYGAESAAIPMTDTGPVPSATDGSRIYTGTIPAAHGAAERQMLRYYITTTDTGGRSWRSPYPVDLTNADGVSQSPEFHGLVIKDAALTANMPIMQWFTNDVANSDTRTGSRASAYYGGGFYDNIYVRQRGGFTSAGSQKFNFNRGDGISVNATLGTVGELNMNAPGSDSSYFRIPLSYASYRQGGHPACESFPVLLYRNGSYQRVSVLIEQVDEDFLDRWGFDEDGALYKFVQRSGETPLPGGDYSNNPTFGDTLYGIEKKTRLHEGLGDLNAFVAGVNLADANARKAFLYANLNLPNFVNFMAMRSLVQDADVVRKNFYLYRDSDDSLEWYFFPWDKDWTLGVNGSQPNRNNPWFGTLTYLLDPTSTKQWNKLIDAAYNTLEIRRMVARRIRTLADEQLLQSGTNWFQTQAAVFAGQLLPLPAGVTPPAAPYGVATTIDPWIGTHRTDLYTTFGPSGTPLVAGAPTGAFITIDSADPNPASGTQDHEYLRIVNNGADEVDISGWTLDGGGIVHTFRAGTVIPGTSTTATLNRAYVVNNRAAFRTRPGVPTTAEFVVGNYDGALSARGGIVKLHDAIGIVTQYFLPVAPTAAQEQLRITELMFAPTAPTPAELAAMPTVESEDFEFIEMQNIGATPFTLTNCRFTDGIDFTFAAITMAPGERILVCDNPVAFDLRYGAGKNRVGPWIGALDNGGERVRIVDNVGEEILDFSYDPRWEPPADGGGHSMVVIGSDPALYQAYGYPTFWALSQAPGGSPGAGDTSFAYTFESWRWDCYDESEIYLPSPPNPSNTVNISLVGLLADSDGDLLNNFMEYAFGRTPTVPDNSALATASIVNVAGTDYLAVTFDRAPNTLDVTYAVETTGDLVAGPWTPNAVLINSSPLGTTIERVTFRDSVPFGAARRFIRVRASKQ